MPDESQFVMSKSKSILLNFWSKLALHSAPLHAAGITSVDADHLWDLFVVASRSSKLAAGPCGAEVVRLYFTPGYKKPGSRSTDSSQHSAFCLQEQSGTGEHRLSVNNNCAKRKAGNTTHLTPSKDKEELEAGSEKEEEEEEEEEEARACKTRVTHKLTPAYKLGSNEARQASDADLTNPRGTGLLRSHSAGLLTRAGLSLNMPIVKRQCVVSSVSLLVC
ncbi:hypothetical protein EYF80_020370 [Liparis tanakae]|uniref:Uncharacterized protein n=1 Tax=Liparis tanakae TaxID=230148 RepID=A0A4Z2HU80_9TELE|nr:hypothetical protein EYF80_020370 [Liparis tanakae]